jgi:hypothetical protein
MPAISPPPEDTMSWVFPQRVAFSGPKIAAIKTQEWYLALLGTDHPMINRLPVPKSMTFYTGQRPRLFLAAGTLKARKGN